MTSAGQRLAGLFVAPPREPAGLRLVTSEVEAVAPRSPGASVQPLQAVPAVPAVLAGLRVCVVGGDGGAGPSFAVALAQRLGRLPGARCAVLCHATAAGHDDVLPAAVPGPASPAARRAARALGLAGHAAELRGRVVALALPEDPDASAAALAVVAQAAPGAPVLTLLPGPRSTAFDSVVAIQDVVVALMPAGGSGVVAELAAAELRALAPGAAVRTVPLARRPGALALRRAAGQAIEGVR